MPPAGCCGWTRTDVRTLTLALLLSAVPPGAGDSAIGRLARVRPRSCRHPLLAARSDQRQECRQPRTYYTQEKVRLLEGTCTKPLVGNSKRAPRRIGRATHTAAHPVWDGGWTPDRPESECNLDKIPLHSF